MQNRFWIGVGMFLTVFLCMAVMRHHRTHTAEDQSAAIANAEAASSKSPADAPSDTPRPVVHGVPTSMDAGNLAMEWIEWNSAERNMGYRLEPVYEIENRLPTLQEVRQKLADMPLQDDCAKAAQRAELASMDA